MNVACTSVFQVENLVGLAVFENYLYATKHTNNSIIRIHRFNAYIDRRTLIENVNLPSTIRVMHRARQPKPESVKCELFYLLPSTNWINVEDALFYLGPRWNHILDEIRLSS